MEFELNSIEEQRLVKLNNGFNFGSLFKKEEVKRSKKYFIEVILKTSINLKEKDEELEVRNDLLGYYHSSYEQGIESFFKDLEEFVKKPLVNITNFNRKEEVSRYDLGLNIRDKTINFSDVEIHIGELAEKKLKELDVDFKEKVKEILSKQKKRDEKLQALVDRYVFLKESWLVLDKCVGKKKDSYSYSNRNEDKTQKLILLTPEQYNLKLKEIEKEIRCIGKKLGITIGDYQFKYIEIKKPLNFDEWLEEHKEELEENFESGETECDSFEEYAQMCFDEFGNYESED
jgi:hypothetical protein